MAESNNYIRVEISYKTFLFGLGLLILLWFIIQIREIIILLFLSLIFLSSLLKPVEWLVSKRIPRLASVFIIYFILLAFIAFAFGLIIPPLIVQTSDFISKLPQILSTANNFLLFHQVPIENLSNIITSQIQKIGGDIFSITKGIFSSFILVVTLIVLTFYMLLQWRKFIKLLSSPFSTSQEKMFIRIVFKVEKGLGNWVRGQLALSLTVGVLSFIGLVILDVPFALPLALLAAIFEIIPMIGPILSAIPAILVGLTISPAIGLAVLALYFVIQQFENHVIVPLIMSKVVGLQPPVVIVALLIGAKLAGIGGAFLAVPILVISRIVFTEIFSEDKNIKKEIADL